MEECRLNIMRAYSMPSHYHTLLQAKANKKFKDFSNNLIKKPCLILKLLVCRAYIKLNRNKKEG